MPGQAANARRLALVERAFRSLPARYLGAPPGFDATYQIRLADIGHTWEVRVDGVAARVRRGASRRRPDVVIGTDAATWLALREGDLSGLEAFSERRLYARGNLDLAVGFEGLFRLPGGREPLLRIHDVAIGRTRVSTLTMGVGPDLLLVHGLGATKASFFETAAALSRTYRVHAVDLPGFGSSSKPATASYDAAFFADNVLAVMDELGIERARLAGNSLGGRVAIEVGLRAPERVAALALLCPAVAFVRRGYHPIVRLLRPELGLLPHNLGRERVARQFWALFCDAEGIDPSMAELVVDEFQRIYGMRGARLAFLAAARNVYLERPFGRGGFYPRLAELRPPALFAWGSHDRVIPAAFGGHVARWLPSAEQIVIEACGHAPQVERPQQTNGLLHRFFARADALEAPRPRLRVAAA
ncbi:MAG TPA: alpha/beta fold hydrolase [Solirubrobacteraceae bacterium]|nr:alpha/beta fold hydrolase [Solirubrobacteraceae bacterium]